MANKKPITLTGYFYYTECVYCKQKKNDCMQIVGSAYPIFICGDCRKLGREYDNTQYWIYQEDVVTPGGKVLEPKERYVEFTESQQKKPKQNKSRSEPYVEPD